MASGSLQLLLFAHIRALGTSRSSFPTWRIPSRCSRISSGWLGALGSGGLGYELVYTVMSFFAEQLG